VVDAFADRPELFSGMKLDLWEANRQALIDAGVRSEHIEVAGVCTSASPSASSRTAPTPDNPPAGSRR